jgi:ATP-dependent Clp protease adapter protein ClpS
MTISEKYFLAANEYNAPYTLIQRMRDIKSAQTIENPATTPSIPTSKVGDYRVIIYNDDHHGMDEVILQLHKATQYALQKCAEIMLEAHMKGRAICYHGSREDCHRVAKVLREIRLQCEVDCD